MDEIVESRDALLESKLCFVSTPEREASFWGRYIQPFQFRASLRLTRDLLLIENCAFRICVERSSMRGVHLKQLSRLAKPIKMYYISMSYSAHGSPKTIVLCPVSTKKWGPSESNKTVLAWFDALTDLMKQQ